MPKNNRHQPIADAFGPTIANAIGAALDVEGRMLDLGFQPREFGELVADNCVVTLYRVGGEWEIDIALPNGSGIACDVPCRALTGRSAEEIKASASRNSSTPAR